MQFKQMSLLFQFLTIIFVLMLSFVPNSNLAIGTDSATEDLAVPIVDSNTKRASPAILADNVNYEEELMLEIWKDGSVQSLWKLEDAGNDLLTFPTALPTPLNSSYPGVGDMRIDFFVSESPQLSDEWGYMAAYDLYADDTSDPNYEYTPGDADYASFSSNEILVNFRVWNETVNNSGILYDGLNDTLKAIKDIIDDLSAVLGIDFHLMVNRTLSIAEAAIAGINRDRFMYDPGVEQLWRGFLFDMNDTWGTLFSLLPLSEGLTTTNTSRLMQASARSLYLVAEWDENPDREGSPSPEEEDERWEFEAMFGILEGEKIALNASSNQIFMKDLLNFDDILRSHEKANESSIAVRLPYGSRIDNIEPLVPGNINSICYFEFDLIRYNTKRVTEFDSVTFTLDALPMPSLLLQATTNATVVSPGDIVQIDYNLTNIGNSPAYNVFLRGFDNDSGSETEWNFINVTEGNFNYTYWDSASDRAYFSFSQIDAGESVVHSVILNATITSSLWNRTFASTSYVDYSGNPTTGTPTGWIQTVIRNWGNDLGFWYNHSNPGPEINVKAQLTNSTVVVGNNFTISTVVTNTGNKTAYSIEWWAPYQLNITNRNGVIESLAPGESVIVNTTYMIDAASRYITDSTRREAPTRQLGSSFDFYETSRYDPGGGYDYSGWFIDRYTDNVTLYGGDIWGSEIKLDVLPASNQTLGPFLTVNVQHSADYIPSGERDTVSITVTNAGNATAENVVVISEFSDAEFAFYAGAGTLSGGQGTAQARRLTYSWGTLAPGDSFSFSYMLEARKNASIYTNTYAVTDWDAFTTFGGLTRAFYPRTYDWEAPTIDGPEDLEIIKRETDLITANLFWVISDEHSGTYQLLRGTLSSVSGEDITYNEVSSGNWSIPSFQITFSLAALEDGKYEFILEATDCCGNSAIDRVNVTIETLEEEPEGDGLIEETEDFFSENATFLLIIGALAVIVIVEGAIIYFMRK